MKKKGKAERDPNKPKKLQTAFFYYMSLRREQEKANSGTVGMNELAKRAGEEWKAMSEEEKNKYRQAVDQIN